MRLRSVDPTDVKVGAVVGAEVHPGGMLVYDVARTVVEVVTDKSTPGFLYFLYDGDCGSGSFSTTAPARVILIED